MSFFTFTYLLTYLLTWGLRDCCVGGRRCRRTGSDGKTTSSAAEEISRNRGWNHTGTTQGTVHWYSWHWRNIIYDMAFWCVEWDVKT